MIKNDLKDLSIEWVACVTALLAIIAPMILPNFCVGLSVTGVLIGVLIVGLVLASTRQAFRRNARESLRRQAAVYNLPPDWGSHFVLWSESLKEKT